MVRGIGRLVRHIFRRHEEEVEPIPAMVVEDPCFLAADDELATRLYCIVTYQDNAWKMALNYTLLALNVVACYQLLGRRQHATHSEGTGNLITLVTVVTFFQIGLCLGVGCYGISIIWCACAGWYFQNRCLVVDTAVMDPQQTEPRPSDPSIVHKGPLRARLILNPDLCRDWAVGLVNVGAILYFAETMETITTVAHLCAVVLGILLSFVLPDDGC
mmetsp:Transcript_29117/g.60914  ORF Transcript_29117/g.60914 Transcript_29117/m.60914 type:complete len:216 (-) Transcript_29117:855-1502(-)